MSREIMQQALSAFEAIMFEKDAESCQIIAKNARYSLREALAQPEQAIGDIRALKHRIHELEGEVIGYKRILDAQDEQEPFKPDWVSYRQGVVDGAAQPEQEEPLPLVDIGVDVTPEGTHVVACYNRPDAVQEMFYSQFHPLTKHEQEPVNIHCPSCLHSFSIVPVAKRKWVGLHLDDMPDEHVVDRSFLRGARWAESKLKEKNT